MNNPWYYRIDGKLYKKQKPCFVGDFVHIKPFNGCFRVHEIKLDYFVVVKNREKIKITWGDFICFKGNGHSEETILRRKLKRLANSINLNIIQQINMNKIINQELQNLRKTFY
jgi:hypothetical protein